MKILDHQIYLNTSQINIFNNMTIDMTIDMTIGMIIDMTIDMTIDIDDNNMLMYFKKNYLILVIVINHLLHL